jgi:hypothetical protein
MEKASYSLSAIRHCKQLVQNTSWSARLKSEHYSRSAEINSLFASCQELPNSILFCPDLSPAYDYQQMVISKKYTKAQLDNQLRVCRSTVLWIVYLNCSLCKAARRAGSCQ